MYEGSEILWIWSKYHSQKREQDLLRIISANTLVAVCIHALPNNMMQNDWVRPWCFRPIDQGCILWYTCRCKTLFSLYLGFFSDESVCEALKNYLKYLKRIWSWHHTLPPRCFKVYMLHTLWWQREDLKTQHLLGSVEKCKVKIAKSEAIFFMLFFESNLCSELLLNVHPIFLLGATSCFAWKWNEKVN